MNAFSVYIIFWFPKYDQSNMWKPSSDLHNGSLRVQVTPPRHREEGRGERGREREEGEGGEREEGEGGRGREREEGEGEGGG